SLVVLGFARSYPPALLAVVLLSAGWSLMINVGNVLTPLAFQSEAAEAKVAYATNLANVFFGLGAFLTPLAVAFLVRWLSFSTALVLLGLLSMVPAGLAIGVDFASLVPAPVSAAATEQTRSELLTLLRDPM